jgi:hypothetical protein
MPNTTTQYHLKVYSAKLDDNFVVNGKSISKVRIAPVDGVDDDLGEEGIKMIAKNVKACFPSNTNVNSPSNMNNNANAANKTAKDYYVSLMEFLLNEYTIIDEDNTQGNTTNNNSNNNNNNIANYLPQYVGDFKTLFQMQEDDDPITNLKSSYEFVVLYDASKTICASCLVHKQKIYGSYEIHEVCVRKGLTGVCSKFIPMVFDYYRKDKQCTDIRIFCIKNNLGACKCYGRIPGCLRIDTERTSAFILRLNIGNNIQNVGNNNSNTKSNTTMVNVLDAIPSLKRQRVGGKKPKPTPKQAPKMAAPKTSSKKI